MKKLLMLSVIIFIISCDDIGTKEFLNGLNTGPKINFVSSGNNETPLLEDSLKTLLDLKATPSFFKTDLSVSDENDNLSTVSYAQVSGLGTLIQDEDTIRNSNIRLDQDVLEFEYYPRNYGEHIFTLTATDDFGVSNSIRVNLVVFENILPRAVLGVSRIGALSRYEYEFDASESFDRDARFGGEIVEYEFLINDNQRRILTPTIRWIFPDNGVYDVGLRVRDNNGKWSTRVTETVAVER